MLLMHSASSFLYVFPVRFNIMESGKDVAVNKDNLGLAAGGKICKSG